MGITQDLEVGMAAPAFDRSADEGLLPPAEPTSTDRLLDLEHKPAQIDTTIAGLPLSSRGSTSAT